MQSLVNAVRGTGATNVIMVGGIRWANDTSGFLAHLPTDTTRQLALSFHLYNWNDCRTVGCYQSTLLPITQRMPVITGEFGEGDCQTSFMDTFENFADANNISYLAWVWAPQYGACHVGASFPFTLISDWSGTPSELGSGYHAHLMGLAGGTPPVAPPPAPAPTSAPPTPMPPLSSARPTPPMAVPTAAPPAAPPAPAPAPAPIRYPIHCSYVNQHL
jgi:hypothetical protein